MVSIRAPIRRPGRHIGLGDPQVAAGFNPRPDPKTGATDTPTCPQYTPPLFQSAPRSEDRGDGNPLPQPTALRLVSIRAPIRRPGRHCCTVKTKCPYCVSIRAPIRRPGRPGRTDPTPSTRPVSIRAPIRRPGRQMDGEFVSTSYMFQSAPRSEDRGDTNATSNLIITRTVSIRAPIRRPGRPDNLADV